VRLYWPAQVASIAIERDTQHGLRRCKPTSKKLARWVLSIGGPFCFYSAPDTAAQYFSHAQHLADSTSSLLALPVRQWHDGPAIYIQVELPDYEWQRIFRKEYDQQTEARA
jgi:hypothetical protein